MKRVSAHSFLQGSDRDAMHARTNEQAAAQVQRQAHLKLKKKGGAPRNPAPRNHFLGWIVRTRAATVQMGT